MCHFLRCNAVNPPPTAVRTKPKAIWPGAEAIEHYCRRKGLVVRAALYLCFRWDVCFPTIYNLLYTAVGAARV